MKLSNISAVSHLNNQRITLKREIAHLESCTNYTKVTVLGQEVPIDKDTAALVSVVIVARRKDALAAIEAEMREMGVVFGA